MDTLEIMNKDLLKRLERLEQENEELRGMLKKEQA